MTYKTIDLSLAGTCTYHANRVDHARRETKLSYLNTKLDEVYYFLVGNTRELRADFPAAGLRDLTLSQIEILEAPNWNDKKSINGIATKVARNLELLLDIWPELLSSDLAPRLAPDKLRDWNRPSGEVVTKNRRLLHLANRIEESLRPRPVMAAPADNPEEEGEIIRTLEGQSRTGARCLRVDARDVPDTATQLEMPAQPVSIFSLAATPAIQGKPTQSFNDYRPPAREKKKYGERGGPGSGIAAGPAYLTLRMR